MSERKLKVGMVGVGGFGAHRRLRMRDTGLFVLAAAYDRNAEAMEAAAREDGAAVTGSFGEMLATPGIEAMIVSSGAAFHAEHAIAAMERGLHVFVEKPLASTMEEVRAILAAQKKTGLVVGCGHHDHSADAYSRTVKQRIETGELGTIVAFEATTAHSGGFHIKPGDWRGSREHNPGGMLFQCGVHKLHELAYYFGPVRRIRAVMRYDLHTSETADVAFCQVEFANGLLGSLNAYHITPSLQSTVIIGTKAAIFKDDRPWKGEYGQWIQRIPCPMDGSIEARVPLELEGETDACGNLRSFHRAVTQGGVAYPSAVDGARALAPVFAAEESTRTGNWVEVESFG
jgi:predicted dehydrogenase